MIDSVVGWTKGYCEYQRGSFCKRQDAVSIAQKILSLVKAESLTAKWSCIQAIQREFGNQPKAEVSELKQALRTVAHVANWKDAFFPVHYKEKLDRSFHFLKYSNRLNTPFKEENRLLFISSSSHIFGTIGSTFATNKAHRLSDNGDHILDAFFAVSCAGSDGAFSGFALALGDGAGGHFGDAQQDRVIARAAHFGTKACVRLFSAYSDPGKLKEDLPLLLGGIKGEVQQKAPGESTTLIGCRAFPTQQGFRVIGFNIGDNMLIAWNPQTKQLIQLLSSHATEAGTALLPRACRSFEMQTLDQSLPNGTLLFLLSDGVHDHLPFQEQEKEYPNGLKYRIRTLANGEAIFETISADAPPQDFLNALARKCLENGERTRQAQTGENVQIGDDLSILLCALNQPAPNQATKEPHQPSQCCIA